MNQPTNQELITELKKRIQAGTLKAEVIADQVEAKDQSLLSVFSGKGLLLLIGLTVGATLLICYSLQLTTNSVTSCTLEFQDPTNNQQIEIDLNN